MKILKTPFNGNPKWIWFPGASVEWIGNPKTVYRTCYFRKNFTVTKAQKSLRVYVSADSHYVFYFNGYLVGRGPAKGDIHHQYYETYDIGKFLKIGKNVLAAIVVNYSGAWSFFNGCGGPCNTMTVMPAFVLATDPYRRGLDLDTDRSWRTRFDLSYSYIPNHGIPAILGMGEDLRGDLYPWGWQGVEYDDSSWSDAEEIGVAVPHVRPSMDHGLAMLNPQTPYRMVPRSIPLLEEVHQRFCKVEQTKGVSKQSIVELISNEIPLRISRNTQVSFVLDSGAMTTAYPELMIQSGLGTNIRLVYAEGWTQNGIKCFEHCSEKGSIVGVSDIYRVGKGKQYYMPLNWRAFRYVKVEIETKDEELVVQKLNYIFTAYPFREKSYFNSSQSSHQKLWNISWRTMRLCAHDTFEDCPYYERLQYAADVHVAGLTAGYVSGDWRLMRQALEQFHWSRNGDEITRASYPNRIVQYMPTWSLLWIVALYDYWMHTNDKRTVQRCFSSVCANLEWFRQFLNPSGVLQNVPYWNVMDWVDHWHIGCPPGIKDVSSILNCMYVTAINAGLAMLKADDSLNANTLSGMTDIARNIKKQINHSCWDRSRGVYQDFPNSSEISEWGNAWAILSGVCSSSRYRRVTDYLSASKDHTATLFGRFYVFRAMSKAGYYHPSPVFLKPWEKLLETDLTTWPETAHSTVEAPVRSFCHAWSACLPYEFLAEILGIKPLTPGFETVLIEPKPLHLEWAKGSVVIGKNKNINVSWTNNKKNGFLLKLGCTADLSADILMPCGKQKHLFLKKNKLYLLKSRFAETR